MHPLCTEGRSSFLDFQGPTTTIRAGVWGATLRLSDEGATVSLPCLMQYHPSTTMMLYYGVPEVLYGTRLAVCAPNMVQQHDKRRDSSDFCIGGCLPFRSGAKRTESCGIPPSPPPQRSARWSTHHWQVKHCPLYHYVLLLYKIESCILNLYITILSRYG